MSKYSSKFKLEVIQYCIVGNHSSYNAAQYFNIIDSSQIRRWIRKYKEHGFIIKNKKSSYSGEFKQNVVEYMHNNHLSISETAIQFNLSGTSTVSKWERIYYEEGPQGLYKERCGRNKNMSSKSKKKKDVNKNEDLLEEVQRLRMENEYLKKLNALVQERIKRENKKK